MEVKFIKQPEREVKNLTLNPTTYINDPHQYILIFDIHPLEIPKDVFVYLGYLNS